MKKAMTQEKQGIAIAKALGWNPKAGPSFRFAELIVDHNTMHTAKQHLTAPQRVAFAAELERMCEGFICFATFDEEFQAFLRAIRGTKPAKEPA